MEERMKSKLGLFDAVIFAIGNMIGAGIFALSGLTLRMAGTGALLSFLLTSTAAMFTGLSYAELNSITAKAGGGYSIINDTMHGIFGFLAGRRFRFGYTASAVLYSLSFARHFRLIYRANVIVVAVALIILFYIINFFGAESSSKAETVVVLTKLFALSLFIALSLRNFTPEALGGLTIDVIKIVGASSLVFIAFQGFDMISTMGEELRDATRTIPRAMVISIIIVTTIYELVLLGILSAVPLDVIMHMSPEELETIVVQAAYTKRGRAMEIIMITGAVVSAISAYNAAIFAASRVGYAMGRDGILPPSFGRIHPKTRVPHISLTFSTATAISLAMLMYFLGDKAISTMGYLSSLIFMAAFSLVNVSLIVHRRVYPNVRRPFKVPLYPVTPILAILFLILFSSVMVRIDVVAATIFVVFTIGVIFYYYLGYEGARSLRDVIYITLRDIAMVTFKMKSRPKEVIRSVSPEEALRKFLEEIDGAGAGIRTRDRGICSPALYQAELPRLVKRTDLGL